MTQALLVPLITSHCCVTLQLVHVEEGIVDSHKTLPCIGKSSVAAVVWHIECNKQM